MKSVNRNKILHPHNSFLTFIIIRLTRTSLVISSVHFNLVLWFHHLSMVYANHTDSHHTFHTLIGCANAERRKRKKEERVIVHWGRYIYSRWYKTFYSYIANKSVSYYVKPFTVHTSSTSVINIGGTGAQ